MGRGPRIAEIDALIHGEFDRAEAADHITDRRNLNAEATKLFRRIVKGDI